MILLAKRFVHACACHNRLLLSIAAYVDNLHGILIPFVLLPVNLHVSNQVTPTNLHTYTPTIIMYKVLSISMHLTILMYEVHILRKTSKKVEMLKAVL